MIQLIKLHSYIKETVKQRLRTLKAILTYPHVDIAPGVEIGANCTFGKNVKIYKNTVISQTTIDDFSYLGGNCEIKNCKIGKFCSIAPGVKIGLGMHPVDRISTYPGFYSINASGVVNISTDTSIKENDTVVIGNDVWVGTNCMIMDGVKVCDGAVIAAGSVVTKNVKPYAIIGGIPAKIIRMRFEQEQIEMLEDFKWWDRGLVFCKENASLFLHPEEFFSWLKKKK